MELLAWGFGAVAIYVVVACVGVALGLRVLLTAGVVDWSGARRPAPANPVTIGYRGDPRRAFGYAFETVRYSTELGPAEAWVIPAAAPGELWAIWVHGIGGTRENGYRMARVMHEAGLPVMLITYRNDPGAPMAADRLYSFGLGEWRDLEAAIDWMRGQGARRVVILAESMGGAIVGQYLMRGGNTGVVAGIALDAPALDFPAVVHGLAHRYWLPLGQAIVDGGLALWALLRRDLRAAVCLEAVAAFEGPLFVAHTSRDPLVPVSISERLVAVRQGTLFHNPDAHGHPLAHAHDPASYEARLGDWLAAVREAEAGRFSASQGQSPLVDRA